MSNGSQPLLAHGQSWMVKGTRVRWSVAADGKSARAHSPQRGRSASKQSHNLVKVATLRPVTGPLSLSPGVLNAALEFALAQSSCTVRLAEAPDGRYTVSLRRPGTGTTREIAFDGFSVREFKDRLVRLVAFEKAVADYAAGSADPQSMQMLADAISSRAS